MGPALGCSVTGHPGGSAEAERLDSGSLCLGVPLRWQMWWDQCNLSGPRQTAALCKPHVPSWLSDIFSSRALWANSVFVELQPAEAVTEELPAEEGQRAWGPCPGARGFRGHAPTPAPCCLHLKIRSEQERPAGPVATPYKPATPVQWAPSPSPLHARGP